MFAFEEQSKLSKVIEISTWVLLFVVLVPGTALGYFAETSLPNMPLYPVKRGLESVVLTLTSFSKNAKTLYEINLANVRLQETKQLVASKEGITTHDLSQFDAVMAQLTEANASVATVSNISQKQAMRQQLTQTKEAYKQQLAQIQQQLQNSSTSTQNPPSSEQTKQTSDQTTTPQDTHTSQTDTTTNLSNLSPEDAAALEQKIQDVSTQLDTLDTTDNTKTSTREDTPTPTPTISPTPQPWWPWQGNNNQHHDGNDNNQKDHTQNDSNTH